MLSKCIHVGFFLVYIVLQLVIYPCRGQEISIENDVRFVHNDQLIVQGSSSIQLHFIRKYGGIDVTGDEFMLFKPRSLAIDESGNLYILDSEQPFIKKFDSNGAFIRSIGDSGEGPGEFVMPAGLAIGHEENLLIMDYRQHHITALSPNGDFLYRTILEKDEGCWPEFHPTCDGNFLAGTSWGLRWAGQGEKYNEPIMKIVDPRGHLIQGFGKPRQFRDATMAKTANAVYFILDTKANIWVSFRHQNRIEKYSSDGELLIKIDRKIEYEPTEDPKAIYLGKSGVVSTGVRLSTLNVVSIGIAIDYMDRIWVMTFTRQPKYRPDGYMSVADGESNYVELEVFNEYGILIDELPRVEAFSPLRKALYIKGKRLFLLNGEDASILEYEIVN